MIQAEAWQGLQGFEPVILLAVLAGVVTALKALFELKGYRHEIDFFSGLPSIDSITRQKKLREAVLFGSLVALLFGLALLVSLGRP